MKKYFLLFIFCSISCGLVSWPKKMLVVAPAADVRHDYDGELNTQVLFGDVVVGYQEKDGYVNVRVPHQEIFSNGEWIGCPGWVPVDCLRSIDNEQELRESICEMAMLFEGEPYVWGGRSFYDVDCSGLVGLCYQVHGIALPRNSRCQYKRSTKLEGWELQPADLIFISTKGVFERISHVMIYLGDDSFIEAAGGTIRQVVVRAGVEVLGKPVEACKSGDKTDYGTIYFGTYF